MRPKQKSYNISSLLYSNPSTILFFNNDGNSQHYLEHSGSRCVSVSVDLLEFPIKAISGANSCSIHKHMAAVGRLPWPV